MLGLGSIDELREAHRIWAEDGLKGKYNVRECKWTESVAVGSRDFVEETRDRLGLKIRGRKIVESNGAYELRESPSSAYGNDFTDKIDVLRDKNTYLWESIPL